MDIGELARLLKRPSWLEGDQTGFHMDVDAALWAEAACFKWDFDPADTVKSMVFEIEWIGEGSTASDINRDFYRVCGRFTEDAQFIGRIVEGDHIGTTWSSGATRTATSRRSRSSASGRVESLGGIPITGTRRLRATRTMLASRRRGQRSFLPPTREPDAVRTGGDR